MLVNNPISRMPKVRGPAIVQVTRWRLPDGANVNVVIDEDLNGLRNCRSTRTRVGSAVRR